MTRPLRIEYPGAFYHVMHRGNAGEAIYRSDRDREKFLEYVEKAVGRFGIKVHTYCLMPNHYHFLVETPEGNLSRGIKWINVSYAAYFNRRWQRNGHLFQGRFKAILVDADAYLKQLSRYIHLNPLRAGKVAAIEAYPWSSYPAFAGRAKPPEWLETGWLLSMFGGSRRTAFQAYRGFVEKIDPATLENPSKAALGGTILGEPGFVTWVKETFLSKHRADCGIPQVKLLKPRVCANDVVAAVCEVFGCDAGTVTEKGKKRNGARDVAIYLARELTGCSGIALGRYFGGISGAGITLRCQHLEKAVANNRKLKQMVGQAKERIVNN